MEEGLKSSSAVKHELDLNKDPFDQMEPTLTLTTHLVSRQDLDLNQSIRDVSDNDAEVGEEQSRVEEDRGDIVVENEGLGDEGTAVENSKVMQIENNVAAADGNGDRRGKGRGRRGRKKEVKDSKKDDVSHDGSFLENDLVSLKEELVGVENGNAEDSMVQLDKSNGEGKNNPGKKGRGRKRIKVEDSECHDDDANAHEQVDASSDQCKTEIGKRGIGRKRKNTEGVECLDDDQVKRKKVNTEPSLGQSKRVLRSGTVAVIDGKKHVYGVKDAGLSCQKTENNIDLSEKEILKARNDDNARPIDWGRKKLKAPHGRPPKLQEGNEISRLTSSKKDNLRGPKRSKINGVGDAEAKNEGPGDGGDERLNGDPYQVKKSKLKESKAEVGELGRREQKQAVREQIIDILVKAGWTIQYRPRQTKEYHDAVYVDPEGKTHWSCTLAYRKLKEKVDAGVADKKTISAFTPIPEEVFSTLFRVTQLGKKKRKDLGSKTSKKMTKKKLSKKQSARSSLGGSDNKGSVNHKTRHNLNITVRRKKMGPKVKDGQRRKPCALLARGSSGGGDSDEDEFILYDGKRTLLAWMIDLEVIQSNAQVHYIYGGKKKVKREGKITGDGICCGCCGEVFDLADFESHAGSKLGRPFQNVILQSGQSLLQCLVDSWNKQKEIDRIGFHSVETIGDDPNDDTCNICGDGGDLICCDGCPSTFHQSCLDIQKFPSGDWRCVYCSCIFCGTVVRNSSEDDVREDMIVSELLTCHLCEGKFHLPCVPGDGALDFDSKDLSFCGNECQKIFEGLQVLLGVRHDMDEGFCWRLLRHHDFGRDVNVTDDISDIECNCKLAVAFSIMDECFVPVIDQRSNINVIQSVVYSCGSNFRRLNYNGFYSVILEKGDELIAVASIRVHGNQVVEMPFIGTRYMYRRQGMCRRLLAAIETALSSLGVEKLVIPAIPELIETWTKVFGFTPLEKSKRQEMKYMSMIVFPGTDMLQKPLLKDHFSDGQVTSTGSNADTISEVKPNQDNKGAGLPVESSHDAADGILNDNANCRSSPRPAFEPDAHQTEKVANCSSAQPCSGTIPPDLIDEQHCTKTYQRCVSGIEDTTLNSPVAPMSTVHEEKVTHTVEESKEAVSCLPEGEVECLNHDSDSLDKGCQETTVYGQDINAYHTLEVPAGKDSIASSEMTSDLMCGSTGSVKAASKASHQIEKVVGCIDLPVPNGYVCDKTSTSDLSSLNSPLASQETSHDIMRSNINDQTVVSVGVAVMPLDSQSLKEGAQSSARYIEELDSCSS